VNAAELLDLVDTPRRLVVLSPEGSRLVKAGHAERKALFRERIVGLHLFQQVRDALLRGEGRRIDRDFVLELIAVQTPNEDYEAMFDTFVQWARFADLFAYDELTETLGLQDGS
jgi:NitT/TauT family transport system ATP-binding protein